MKPNFQFIKFIREEGVFALLLLCVLAVITSANVQAQTSDCDRQCLANMITQYVDALVADDPLQLPVADDVRFTEDSRELSLGEGVWESITGLGEYRQDYLDESRQIAASHVIVMIEEDPVLYSVLLYVEGQQITGIETLVNRITPDSRFQPTMLGSPLMALDEPVPAGQAMSRDDMISTALTYTEGLRIGSFVEAPTPFSENAYRIENAVFMAGIPVCPREECPDILTQSIIEHPEVEASVAAVDEEMGIVLLWMNFGDTGSYGENNALVTFEAFKVWGGEIQAVNAFFRILPKDTQRGWPSAD